MSFSTCISVAVLLGTSTALAQDATLRPQLAALTGHAPPGFSSQVFRVALDPLGKYALTATRGPGDVLLWDASNGTMIHELGPDESVQDVRFSPDGVPITVDRNGLIEYWDPQTGEPVRRLETSEEANFYRFSRDGRWLLAGVNRGSIGVWNLETGRQQTILHYTTTERRGNLRDLTIDDDGTKLLAGFFDGSLVLFNLNNGHAIRDWHARQQVLIHARLSGDGRRALTGGLRGDAIVWDLESGSPIQSFEQLPTGRCDGMELSRDGRQALFSHGGEADEGNAAGLWDVESGSPVHRLSMENHRVFAVAFDSNETGLIAGATGAWSAIWDAKTGERLQELRGNTSATSCIVASRDGSHLLVGDEQGRLGCWNLAEGHARMLSSDAEPGPLPAVNFDGSLAAFFTSDVSANVRDTESGSRVVALEWSDVEGTAISVSPDGRRAVTGHKDGSIVVWDVATGERLRRMVASDEPVRVLAFNASGNRLVSGHAGKPGMACTWEIETGRVLHEFSHERAVHSVEFADAGRILLTADTSGAFLRNTTNGCLLQRLPMQSSYGERANISVDGRRIFTYWFKTARLYSADGRELAEHEGSGSIASHAFPADGSIVWKEDSLHNVSAHDAVTDRELLRLLLIDGGEDWLAWTPEGLYDGSSGGLERVRFRLNLPPAADSDIDEWRETVRARQDEVRTTNHRPGLILEILGRRR